jgi:hypothetical protein
MVAECRLVYAVAATNKLCTHSIAVPSPHAGATCAATDYRAQGRVAGHVAPQHRWPSWLGVLRHCLLHRDMHPVAGSADEAMAQGL